MEGGRSDLGRTEWSNLRVIAAPPELGCERNLSAEGPGDFRWEFRFHIWCVGCGFIWVMMGSVKHTWSQASFSFPSSGFSGLCASPTEEPHGALISSCNYRTMTDVSWYFSLLGIQWFLVYANLFLSYTKAFYLIDPIPEPASQFLLFRWRMAPNMLRPPEVPFPVSHHTHSASPACSAFCQEQ